MDYLSSLRSVRVYGFTLVRRNFDLLHFFQPITKQQNNQYFKAMVSLVEKSVCLRSKFRRTVVRSYVGAIEVRCFDLK